MTFYTESQRALQSEFDSRKLADAVEGAIVEEQLSSIHSDFIETRDFFFLSTVNLKGEPTVSYKGGDVGLVKVVDDQTLVFPAYDGNGMFLSMGNIDETAKIGLLFIDFETPNRIRVQADATLRRDDPLLSLFPGAKLLVRATVTKVFLNCARYIHKYRRVEQSPYIPDNSGQQRLPAWKRIDFLQDELPKADQGLALEAGGLITIDEYFEALSKGES